MRREETYSLRIHKNNQSKGVTVDKTPLIVALKKIKCLEINLVRNVQNLYEEHFKMCLNDTKVDMNTYKDIPCSLVE